MPIAISRARAADLKLAEAELREQAGTRNSLGTARLWPNPIPVISAAPDRFPAMLRAGTGSRWGFRFLGEIESEPVCLDFSGQAGSLTFSALLGGPAAGNFAIALKRAERRARALAGHARLALAWAGPPGSDALVMWRRPETAVAWPLMPKVGRGRALSLHLAAVVRDFGRFAAMAGEEEP